MTFKFVRHVSLHIIKSLLKNVLFEITNYGNNVYLISYLSRRSNSLHRVLPASPEHELSPRVHYLEH